MFRLVFRQPVIVIIPLLLGLSLALGGCDFGAAQNAVESAGVTVDLPSIETTVSGQLVDAATGELGNGTVTLRFEGPDDNAIIDMYSDPIASQTVTGAVTSFGIENGRTPSSENPVHLRVVADAEDYLPTSDVLEIHETGPTQFRMSMLSEDPTKQPDGVSGVRNQSGYASADGRLEADLRVQTPSTNDHGGTDLFLPEGSVLRSNHADINGQLTVDLIHYSSTDATRDALPGQGTVQTDTGTERFAMVGYMHLQIRDANGDEVSTISDGDATDERSQTRVWLPQGATLPSNNTALREGEELELFQYHPEAGTWTSETTLTVKSRLGEETSHERGAHEPTRAHKSSRDTKLGLQWSSDIRKKTGWWAWGTRSSTSCDAGTRINIAPSSQNGNLEVTLQRPGLTYQNTHPVEEVTDSTQVLSTLVGQSMVPRHTDYELTLTTRDGQSRTIDSVDPCGGAYSITLPTPTPVPRTDVLFRAFPECPGDQKMRITSLPSFTIYYRQSNAPMGARWHTASSDKITWVMDDPDTPTYVKWTELRLDGLKQDTHYDLFTTYGGDLHEQSGLVPTRGTATIEDGRVLVKHSQDFSDFCS